MTERKTSELYPKKSVSVKSQTKDKLDNMIKVKMDTHMELTRKGRKGTTYNDIIEDLIAENKDLNKENQRLKRRLRI